MKFVIEHVGKNGGRIGKITNIKSQPEVVHETPMFIVSTLGGSAPHLTQDAFHLVCSKEVPLSVPAQHFSDHVKTLETYKKGVAQFAALKSHSVCVTVQDAAKTTPSGYNEKKGVSLWTYGGRQVITSEKYMRLVEAMQPDWFEALNDADTDKNSTKKRVSKSLLLSKSLLEQCVEAHKNSENLQDSSFFIPLLGGHCESERTRWSKAVAGTLNSYERFGGFSLLGMHTNGSTAETLAPKLISSLTKSSLDPLPSEYPRQSFGAWNPLAILSLTKLGVDIFDSAFPFLVTERKAALKFPVSLDSESDETPVNDSLTHQSKKLKTENAPEISNGQELSEEIVSNEGENPREDNIISPFEMSLKDERHNLHHWTKFFESIRSAIKTGRLTDLEIKIQSYILDIYP